MRILVIDDDVAVRSYVTLCLRREGHEVFEASDGQRGMRWLDREPVDVVVTDIFMPHTDGIEVVRAMKARGAPVPVVAISGGGRQISADFLSVAMAFGANAVLPKPFSPSALAEAVARAVDGHLGSRAT
jgi:CheY-like chemotaxis protein